MQKPHNFKVGDVIITFTSVGFLIHKITECVSKRDNKFEGYCIYNGQSSYTNPELVKPGWKWQGVLRENDDKKTYGLVELLYKHR